MKPFTQEDMQAMEAAILRHCEEERRKKMKLIHKIYVDDELADTLEEEIDPETTESIEIETKIESEWESEIQEMYDEILKKMDNQTE